MRNSEIIEVVSAHQEGKVIEFRNVGYDTWYVAERPDWDFYKCDYRVKPDASEEDRAAAVKAFNAQCNPSATKDDPSFARLSCIHCNQEHNSGDCPELKDAVEKLKASYPSKPQSSCEELKIDICTFCGTSGHRLIDCPARKKELHSYDWEAYAKRLAPDTFDWKTAAKLWAEDVSLEIYDEGKWMDLTTRLQCKGIGGVIGTTVQFCHYSKYRRKPSPATPDKKEEESDTYKTNKIRLSIIDLKLRVSAIEKALHANGIYE